MRVYKANEIDNQRFYQIPKGMFSERYRGLSSDARLVYALLRDRMELSQRNGWVNEQNEVYLLYGQEQLCDMLDLSRPTIAKALNLLIKYELIVVKRQGLTLPNIIFVGHVEASEPSKYTRCKHPLHQEVKNIYTNDTDKQDVRLPNITIHAERGDETIPSSRFVSAGKIGKKEKLIPHNEEQYNKLQSVLSSH